MQKVIKMHVIEDTGGFIARITCTDGTSIYELTGYGETHDEAVYSADFDYQLGPYFWAFRGRVLETA